MGAGRPVPRVLHILNGDSTADLLRLSGVPGTPAVWADVLHGVALGRGCRTTPRNLRDVKERRRGETSRRGVV